jgi:cobalt-zinc-cadmium efflux system membrane fusion protein
MKRRWFVHTGVVLAGGLLLAGCSGVRGQTPSAEAALPPARVTQVSDGSVVSVAHPGQFPLATAGKRVAPSELTVTGVVNPDVARAVPVISLATGRVIEIRARLGDQVDQGQLLMRVQSPDISAAWSDHQHAIADETLARAQFERARGLYAIGAIAQKDLEVAQDLEAKAVVDVNTTALRLRVLGVDPSQQPTGIVDLHAPVAGVITDQQVTMAGGVSGLGSPNPFTISDLSWVWIICDVYENDVATLHINDTAEIYLNAFPDRVLSGRISNIFPILDPTIRTAKVRIEVQNPNLMKIGMFVTARFRSQRTETHTMVPATALVHLHDRDFVYVPTTTTGRFQRVEVVGGNMLPGNLQDVLSGLTPGVRVVANGLVFANTVEQ